MRGRWLEICLSLVVAGVVAASGSSGASASETYVCADGRILKVDQTNREKLADDPCIKAWFQPSGPVAEAEARDAGGGGSRAGIAFEAQRAGQRPRAALHQRQADRRRLRVFVCAFGCPVPTGA